MRYYEINTDVDFGPRHKWKATLSLPVSKDNWARWKEIIKAHGVDVLLKIEDMASDSETKLITVGCPSRKVAEALDDSWSAVLREGIK